MARTIILGYDGSECANDALGVAVDLARDAPGSTVVVVHGRKVDLALGAGPAAAEAIAPDLQDVDPVIRAAAQDVLDAAAGRITAAGVSAETVFKVAAPHEAILDAAEARHADLIVVGSHGTGAIRGVLAGSVPYKLLHHSRVPVVVVPHRDKGRGHTADQAAPADEAD